MRIQWAIGKKAAEAERRIGRGWTVAHRKERCGVGRGMHVGWRANQTKRGIFVVGERIDRRRVERSERVVADLRGAIVEQGGGGVELSNC